MNESAPDDTEPTMASLFEQLDTEGMTGFTRSFVHDLRSGFEAVNNERFPWIEDMKRTRWQGVLCLGMGGSAAGGDFLATLAGLQGSVPVHVHRDYQLPAWWSPAHLVLATSYSGNTEETVAATEAALRKGGTVVVIATGGHLAGLTETSDSCHLIPCTGGQPPRTAFGHMFSRQLALMEHLGFIQAQELQHRNAMLDRLQQHNESLDVLNHHEGDIALLAASLAEQPIAALGPTELSPVLNRLKNQFNENASRFVRVGSFPEMNHNESVAWGGVGDSKDPDAPNQALLFLSWDGMHPRVKQRMAWMVAHCTTETAWNLVGEGSSLLETLLYHCMVMDWLSLALGVLHGKNPANIGPIDSLKGHLGSVQ